MRAAVQTRYGPPGVVRLRDVERPAAGPGELLVKVHATSVNRTDCGYRAAKPLLIRIFSGLRRPRAHVLGSEFAGVVEEVGDGVTVVETGARVFGYNEGRFGGHAEYLTLNEDAWIAGIPDGVTFDQAAVATEGAHYALSFIVKAGVGSGDAVLVNGATGAIGSAAVQLVKALGASVTAVCATEHLDLVRGLGADRVVDYTAGDFTDDRQAYDVVLDAVGKSTFGRCRRLLKPGGVYLSSEVGPFWQNPVLALVGPLVRRRRRVLFPIPSCDPETVRYLAGLLASGVYRPLIDRHFPLERIVEAYEYVETGQKVGNVVIDVAGTGSQD